LSFPYNRGTIPSACQAFFVNINAPYPFPRARFVTLYNNKS